MDPALKDGTSKNAANVLNGEKAQWPLAFKIQPHAPEGLSKFGATSTNQRLKKRWWSHLLYRGPNNEQVKILYSKTRVDSETLAQQFLKETVVGFDMEWPWDDRKRPNKLQNKIGLIQVATEEKVALFHIGLHTGETTDDIMAPSLRKLIESPDIGKIGVGILNADFARLNKYFKLQPKAAVELSHLHRLVTFGGRKPELVSTKLTSLATQVEEHLGHPLYKGDVRTSNWSKPLSQEQIKYAAGDAYAGLMLYHCMNYKRFQMNPVPPMPIHAEKYLGYELAGTGSLYLEPLGEGGKIMTSAFFFGVPTITQNLPKIKLAASALKAPFPDASKTNSSITNGKRKSAVPMAKTETITLSLSPIAQALFEELCIRRKAFADENNVPEYRIASNQILVKIAQERPLNSESLMKIKGVGAWQEKNYGNGWIETISTFMAKNDINELQDATSAMPVSACTVSNTTVGKSAQSFAPDHNSRPIRTVNLKTPYPSSTLVTHPPPRTPSLHTGLSFTLAETGLTSDASTAEDSDDSLPSLDFGESSSERTSSQKRKRNESPIKRDRQRCPQGQQEVIRNNRYQAAVSGSQHLKPSPEARTASIDPPTSAATAETPLTPRSNIFRNKLVAFSKLVATRKKTDAAKLVSSKTLEMIARRPPQTNEELRRITGIEDFFHACADTNMDLLEKIHKFAPARD